MVGDSSVTCCEIWAGAIMLGGLIAIAVGLAAVASGM